MSAILRPNLQTYKAGGTISRGKAVKMGADDKHVVQCTATTDQAIGIADNDAVAEGSVVVAHAGGGAHMLAKGTIARGDRLGINADGSIQKVAGSGDWCIGQALESAVANDIFAGVVSGYEATAAQA